MTSPAVAPTPERADARLAGEELRPAWSLPALLFVAAAAACSYRWGATHQSLEVYYQAAVRSMSANWHDFAFGAFDPRGTVSVDKLPGGLWVQALSVRAFGFHTWAIELPQVVEGVATVLLLHRAVVRVAGPVAAIVAAAAMAITPVTVALGRGNISDSLLILLLVAAANTTVTALRTGRARWLLVAGLWVGLAFQAKMLQAWFVLPAIAAAWLLAGIGPWWRRGFQVGAAVLVAALVSVSWMTAVSSVGSSNRPYADGSAHDSVFSQVFEYNGFSRVDDGGPPHGSHSEVSSSFSSLLDFRLPARSGPARVLAGAGGRDVGWLVPAALIAAVGVVLARRRRGSRDLVAASCVFWATWLLIHLVAFTVSSGINAYYLAALTPAVAALCGIGVAEVVRAEPRPPAASWALLTVAAGTVVYGMVLTPARVGPPRWAEAAVALVVLGAAAWALLGPQPKWRAAGCWIAVGAMAVLPAAGAVDLVAGRLGPFDTPYQPASTTRVTQVEPRRVLDGIGPAVALLEKANRGRRYVAATQSSILAAPLIVATGREFEPIGGFLGTSPSPTLAALRHQIARGEVSTFLVTPSTDPRVAWIRGHCLSVPNAPGAVPSTVVTGIEVYFCAYSSAKSPA